MIAVSRIAVVKRSFSIEFKVLLLGNFSKKMVIFLFFYKPFAVRFAQYFPLTFTWSYY